MSKGGKTQTVVQKQKMAPGLERAANRIGNRAFVLQGRNDGNQQLTPDLSADTQAAQELLRGGPDPFIESQFRQLASGQINPAVEAAVTRAASQAVGDRFAQAGRSGSPAEGISLGSTIADSLAPFAVQAQQQGLQGLLGLDQMEARNLLASGQITEEQQRQRTLDPFRVLEMTSGPLASVLGGAPRTQIGQQPVNRNIGAGVLGGAATGAGLGQALGLSGLGPLGAAAGLGGILGVF